MQIVPTLHFGGTCREAIHVYERAFNGTISCLISCGQAHDPKYDPLLSEAQREYVYHAELLLGGQRIILSDNVDIAFHTITPAIK